jgi:monoamine oxidase
VDARLLDGALVAGDPDEVRPVAPPTVRPHPLGGTETATISYGAIDGAVRSGERAAEEIIHHGAHGAAQSWP